MQKFKHILVFYTLLFLLLSCQKNNIPEIEIIAKVDKEYLTRDQLFEWMPSTINEAQKKVLARQYIDRWVQKTTMALSAKNEGISLSSYEKWSLQNYQKELLAQKYVNVKLPCNEETIRK